MLAKVSSEVRRAKPPRDSRGRDTTASSRRTASSTIGASFAKSQAYDDTVAALVAALTDVPIDVVIA